MAAVGATGKYVVFIAAILFTFGQNSSAHNPKMDCVQIGLVGDEKTSERRKSFQSRKPETLPGCLIRWREITRGVCGSREKLTPAVEDSTAGNCGRRAPIDSREERDCYSSEPARFPSLVVPRVSSHPALGYSISPEQAFGVLRRFKWQ